MQEIWKDVVGYEGLYQVSNLGRVKSLIDNKNIILKFGVAHGYRHVGLRKNKKSKSARVNRIVASAFIDNPNNKPCVNHIDGNKLNNYANNLEWCTYSENSIHAIENGLYVNRKVIQKINNAGEVISEYKSATEAAIKNKCFQSNISKCATGKIKTAYGYMWKYI